VDRHRLEDYKPYIYRTRDGGKTWKEISNGIPDGSYVNAVKEDPVLRGLLFAGTELGVYVSFDDGDHWQPLQLNLPVTSARDFAIHGDDLIVATHGRGFWILDDITPLRQVTADTAGRNLVLFLPQTAIRTRPNGFDGTPLPYGTPVAENPPTGAILNYYLKSDASGPVTLEILDSAGKPVRKYSSEDKAPKMNLNMLPIPSYWIHTPATLATTAGMHRWVWDLRYASTDAGGGGLAALFGFGGGMWAAPGAYTVKLTVSGESYRQPLVVKMDPRVKAPLADLTRQFTTSQEITAKQAEVRRANGEVKNLRDQIHSLRAKAANNSELVSALDALDKKVEEIGGAPSAGGFDFTGEGGPSSDFSSLRFVDDELGEVLRSVQGADAAPTEGAMQAFAGAQKIMNAALAKWTALKSKDLASVNALIQQANLPPIDVKLAKAPSESRPE
jgi:hypothetical protein